MLYDRDIRDSLCDFLEERYGKIRIIEEKQMGRSRADMVMVTPDEIIGIEIKSDADTYARLERQVKDYDRFYDRNYAVVGTRHAMHIEEHVPAWWGIITVEPENGKPDFYVLRGAKPNPDREMKRKLSLLWRSELAHIQELNGMCSYRGKSKAFVAGKILREVSPERLAAQISEELFQRDYTRREQSGNGEKTRPARTGRKRKKREGSV